MKDMNCADKKATKLLTELENLYNLIERKLRTELQERNKPLQTDSQKTKISPSLML